jgi:hypothetical protein
MTDSPVDPPVDPPVEIFTFTYSTIIGSDVIIRDDGAQIPPDPANSDYSTYLRWIDEGNVAEVLPEPHPTAAEREEAAAVSAELLAAVGAAVDVNTNLATQNVGIIGFCQAVAQDATSADQVPLANLVGAVRVLAGYVQILAEHDAEALSQRSGIVKLLPGAYDDVGHDAPPEQPAN